MKEYFKLLGWQSCSLVLIGMLMLRTQIIIPFYQMYFPFTIIPFVDFLAFTFGMVLMMASFNVICSYYDTQMSDIIAKKKPTKAEELEQKNKYRMFWVLAILALAMEGFVAIKDNAWQVLGIGIVFELGAYFYALKYKREYLIGNIVISLLFAIIVFMPMLLEVFAFKNYQSEFPLRIPVVGIQSVMLVFVYFAAFVFLITFIRDLTLDLANVEDNKQKDLITFPVKEGVKATKILLNAVSVLFIALNVWFVYQFYEVIDMVHIVFILVLNIAFPMVYYLVNLNRTKLQMQYVMLYQYLGMVYISLLLTILFAGDIFKINAII